MSKEELIARILARRGQGEAMCTCVPLQPAARPGGADAGAQARPEGTPEHGRSGPSGAARAELELRSDGMIALLGSRRNPGPWVPAGARYDGGAGKGSGLPP